MRKLHINVNSDHLYASTSKVTCRWCVIDISETNCCLRTPCDRCICVTRLRVCGQLHVCASSAFSVQTQQLRADPPYDGGIRRYGCHHEFPPFVLCLLACPGGKQMVIIGRLNGQIKIAISCYEWKTVCVYRGCQVVYTEPQGLVDQPGSYLL